MVNLGENMTIEQVDEILRHFDENGDGQISPDEFSKALTEEKMFGSAAVKTVK